MDINVRKRFCYHERHYALSRRIFLDGETKLKPMILKDIADMVGLDISTISRSQSKYVETPYGTKLIKEFFSESMKTIKVKMFLHSKSRKSFRIRLKKKTRKPLPDDQLAEILKRKAIQSQEEPLQNTENNSIFQCENEEEDVKLLISDSVL
jgi:hypothetical protein